MGERLHIWLAVLAIVIGLGSVGATYGITQQQAHKDHAIVCTLVDSQNEKTRDFVTKLLADPTVSTQARTKITDLALKQFPLQSCAVAVEPVTTSIAR